ncbi:acyltransferase ChoActase/COT/CPT [Cylindrobasidium torrendii FP15055 ss-10]|uniref:Acyltransferase ChoActase/COT/CPT n=1 Tax=Cylindrobasidium torrendii FP15055 ss-10 TaxID=1314674 RepID=A0A0D7BPB4_9AGAR|nr:acyltransferase ChoActase/COT/CPT [Cylindrobasidium torrendii FP15055 ss-10]
MSKFHLERSMTGVPTGKTFASQEKLPKLPVPPLEDTCKRYLRALEALQDPEEHKATQAAVRDFLEDEEQGPRIQKKLEEWALEKASYIEDFWYESYLQSTDPVVLALNPFFVLENDPSPDRGTQLPRAASLIVSSLGFIHDLRKGVLEPDTVRGTPLDMDQYHRLFGSARIPTAKGCQMQVHDQSRHLVVLRRGQFYWFDVLDDDDLPILTERDIIRNLRSIIDDADKTPRNEVARGSIGVLSTENRKVWSSLRTKLSTGSRTNKTCLDIVDAALFIVCLDDVVPEDTASLCTNFLCGTYKLEGGVQVGTVTNRWYDKLQIIVCADGAAGINFEHTGVDGHTVLRFAADIFTEGLMLLARSINPTAPTLFHAKLSPHAPSYKPPRNSQMPPTPPAEKLEFDVAPKKLEWKLDAGLRVDVRYAETRISDLICQNDCQALEWRGYGKDFITRHGFSPDAFVQMAFQAAYFGLYGRIECTYEPAMTKAFLHGRTEAIRTVQPESVAFTRAFFSEASASDKIAALHKACSRHVKLTRECGQGLGQDRHLYALYCLLQKEREAEDAAERPSSPKSPLSSSPSSASAMRRPLPSIFSDGGWKILNTSILSTSNCGNPALRLFGFGPVAADGYGIGYIIKEDGLSICASSKSLQTRRFLDTIKNYLHDVQKMLNEVDREANQAPEPFVDHSGVLRDSKTGHRLRRVSVSGAYEEDEDDEEEGLTGFSFFDSGDVELMGNRRRRRKYGNVGTSIPVADY